VIDTKREFVDILQNKDVTTKGTLEVLPLNALDETPFSEIISRFPAGEIAIVNEGLLVYLSLDEKKKLCGIIRNVLQQRGGYWITADIYIKKNFASFTPDDTLQKFFEEHRIEENKFESFEAAEAFFNSEGFVIDNEAQPEYATSNLLKYLLASATAQQINDMSSTEKIHATWRLKLKEI